MPPWTVGVQFALCANAEYKWNIYHRNIFGIFLFGSCRCIRLYARIASASFIAYVGLSLPLASGGVGKLMATLILVAIQRR